MQAESSSNDNATEKAKNIDQCDEIVLGMIVAWYQDVAMQTLYDERALLKHKQMFDLMQYTKEGDAKENTLISWCRKIASLRMEVGSNATMQNMYKALALDLLANDLLPGQKGIRDIRFPDTRRQTKYKSRMRSGVGLSSCCERIWDMPR